MKITKLALVLACALLNQGGCATTNQSGGSPPNFIGPPISPPIYADANDPVVIDAEKTLAIANDTFNLFVHLERDNQADLLKAAPEIHKYAEVIRRNGLKWIRTANDMKNAYKHNRSAANKANLASAIAVVAEALNQTKNYIKQTGLTGP